MNIKKLVYRNKNSMLIFIAVGFCLLGDAMLYAVLPTRIDLLAMSGVQLGIILSANRFIRLISNFWAARLYEKIGRHLPFIGAVLLGVLITFGYGFAREFWQFLGLRLLWGISYSLLRLKALLMIFDSGLKEDIKGKLSGIFRSISRTGYMVGMILGGYLADVLGFSRTAILLGIISSTAIFLVFRIKKTPSALEGEETLSLDQGYYSEFLKLLTRPRMLAVMLLGFALYFTTRGVINSSYGLYLKEIFGSRATILGFTLGIATLNGLLLSSQSLLELLLGPLLGEITDRYQTDRLLIYIFTIQGGLLGILGFFQNMITALITPVFIFINTAFLTILLYVRIGDLEKSTVSRRMAGFTTATDLGAALGPLFLGLLDVGIELPLLYGLCALLIFVSAVIFMLNGPAAGVHRS